MSSEQRSQLGTWSTLSIGLGGMVGGGIFAVTGLTVQITMGAAPIAFLIAGVVALLLVNAFGGSLVVRSENPN